MPAPDRPPLFFQRLLRLMTPFAEREPLLGDFEEIFVRLLGEGGRVRARANPVASINYE